MEKNPFEEKINTRIAELDQTDTDKAAKEAAIKTAILRTVISVAVAAIVILIIILTVKFIPGLFSGSFFSGLFGKKEKITLTATPQPVTSGTPVTITINHQNKATSTIGTYSFTYDCITDFRFDARISPTKTNPLPCDQTIYTGSATTTPIILIPQLTKGDSVKVPFEVTYTPSGASTTPIVGNTTISVVKGTSTPATTTPPTIPNPPTPPHPPTAKYIDLSVKIIVLGIIDPYTGNLIRRDYANPSDRIGVRFQVTNKGTQASGTWTLQGLLPSNDTPVYFSPAQISLAPGQTATYTLGFTLAKHPSQSQITLIIDPKNLINESNEANNTAQVSL